MVPAKRERTFKESLQKCLRSLEIGRSGLGGDGKPTWRTSAFMARSSSRSPGFSMKWKSHGCCRCLPAAQRTVHRDGHIELARAYYSVPPEYVGRKVWAR
jgi:hypothetical protein